MVCPSLRSFVLERLVGSQSQELRQPEVLQGTAGLTSFGIENRSFWRERYLGVQQNLTDAPCDHLGLKG